VWSLIPDRAKNIIHHEHQTNCQHIHKQKHKHKYSQCNSFLQYYIEGEGEGGKKRGELPISILTATNFAFCSNSSTLLTKFPNTMPAMIASRFHSAKLSIYVAASKSLCRNMRPSFELLKIVSMTAR
jgi:hypothetical protein